MANALQTYTNGTDVVAEIYEYDLFGNRVSTTDAFGNTVHRSYDPFVNVLSKWGAAYPVRNEYDTAGRRILLATTRDGATWDETRWTYDAATGLCTSKIYADDSVVTYTYTPDGLLETTTYSSGRWITNLYDARRQLAGTTSSDGTQNTEYVRDAYGRTIGESNAVVRMTLDLNNEGVATREIRTDGTNTIHLVRTADGLNRLSGLFVPSLGYAESFAYTGDNLISTISNDDTVVTYTYSSDRQDAGYTISFANGGQFIRTVMRDPYRRDVVTAVTNTCGASTIGLAYKHDDLSRPIARNDDVFAYNERGEVAFAEIAGNVEEHAYDLSGNSLWASFNSVTNHYTANNLNQYSSILRDSVPPCETTATYDADGNLISCGPWSYTYDSASRLVTVSSNGVLLVTNQYDCRRRRVKKITPNAVHTFLYDDWNLIHERVDYANSTVDEFNYYWGRDLSGTLQGAGGVGGLLYVKYNGVIYVPHADANGNILRYTDTTGNIVAAYSYDAFGRTISQSGLLSDVFRHRFSSKYFDTGTGLYYYGYRFYCTRLMRWLNRDPIGEDGGMNVYNAFLNAPFLHPDMLGLNVYVIWHLPGDDLLYKWSSPNSSAETYFRASKYNVEQISCGKEKISYKVKLSPPMSLLDVYFRSSLAPFQYWFAKKCEEEHVGNYVAYDKCIEEFKQKVESICSCRQDAEKQKRQAEVWLAEKASYYKSKNDFLDRKGGPHGH